MGKIAKLLRLPAPRLREELLWEVERRWRSRSFAWAATLSPPEVSAGRESEGGVTSALPPFFIDPKQRELYGKVFARSEACREVLAAADDVCGNKFRVFGRTLDLSGGIDWQADYAVGRRWSEKERYFPVERVIHKVQIGEGVDVKAPWELSRFQWVLLLGQAFWATGDEKYSRAFTRLLRDWIQKNPPCRGINWCSPMEAAIRAGNLIWGVYFFYDAMDKELPGQIVSLLRLHGRFIYAHPERWFESTGNHYLANLAGLVYLGIFLGEKKWLAFAQRELAAQVERQILEDGADFEASIPYHRLALECFFYPAWLCRVNGIEWPESFWEKLKKMFSYVRGYTKPDGGAPQIGDNDSGRLHQFSPRTDNDHCYLAAMAGLALNTRMFRPSEADSPEILWILGPQAFASYRKQPLTVEYTSRGFPRAGIYVMRSPAAYFLVAAHSNGFYDKGCHAHNDKLSFELHYRGRDFIADPGSYLYTSSPRERNLFRSTSYHNTVRVDKEEQNRMDEGELFYLRPDSRPLLEKWESDNRRDIFCAVHDGYARLENPVRHRRRIVFCKEKTHWEITDSFEGEGKHLLEWFIHPAPGVEAVFPAGEGEPLLLRGGGAALCLETPRRPERFDAFYSPEYGVKIKTIAIRWSQRVQLPYTTTFNIYEAAAV